MLSSAPAHAASGPNSNAASAPVLWHQGQQTAASRLGQQCSGCACLGHSRSRIRPGARGGAWPPGAP
eukprot:3383734-Rhodomonas_salina.1